MRASPLLDLGRGAQFLWRWPFWSLALAALGTLLSALAPVLQMRSKLPNTPAVVMGLAMVATLPLDLYFIPRFLLAVDANTLDDPRNPASTWKATFESRWMPAFGARLVLYLLVFCGAMCFLFPGLVLLVLYGWAPLRVLLRGESIREAMKVSAIRMLKHWPPVVFSALVIAAVCYLASALAVLGFTRHMAEPTAWQKLTSPSIWAMNFVNMLLGLWLSASFLSLFHRLESETEAVEGPGEEG